MEVRDSANLLAPVLTLLRKGGMQATVHGNDAIGDLPVMAPRGEGLHRGG